MTEAIELVDALPHGATGKVLKTVLRERFAAKALSQTSPSH